MLYGSPTKRQRAFLLLILADVHVCMYIYIFTEGFGARQEKCEERERQQWISRCAGSMFNGFLTLELLAE